jgi:DNA polymerase elongation subunit (family B)
VFFRFALIKDGRPLIGRESLGVTIELAKEAGELATMFLKMPHELEYEKTFYPFILLAKKKYVGMLYEHDTEKCVRKSMGIVLKRRDNAKIVKDAYGSVIDILMQERDIVKSIEFVKKLLRSLVDGQIPIDKLIITKSLRSGYKKPLQMAHKVLADRIGKRDAGNKPKPGDRVRFVFVQTEKVKKVKQLQGDKIETPEYIKEHDLQPDYGHYITNQIMKPLQQLYALILESIPGFKQEEYAVEVTKCKDEKKVEALRNKEVKKLIFNEFI